LEPLKVTFRLRSPLALGFPWINLDSLLLHVKLREELGEKYYTLPTKIPAKIVEEYELPLKRWRDIYAASVSLIDNTATLPGEYRVFSYFKRGDFPFTRGKLRRGSGFFKDFYLRQPYIPAKSVIFYCVGEKEEVERLAKMVTGLGKDRNIGFGLIKDATVEEAEEDCSVTCRGLAMRPIPVSYLESYTEATQLAYKPPYWAKENITLCAVPFTRAEVKTGE
jgi:hypothetical protein